MEIIILIFIVFAFHIGCEGKCLHRDQVPCEINNHKQCIPSKWWCDGYEDCEDGQDEVNCTFNICSDLEFACKTGTQCIPKSLACDGWTQCLDQSDENNCTLLNSESCDYRTPFDCNNDGEHCISLKKVCDGKNDCDNNQDEYPKGMLENCYRDYCKFNGGCSHFCTNTFREMVCHCREGYRLLEDKKTCVDINECLIFHKCSQICNNTDGSYKCLCHEGYILNPNVSGECISKVGDRIILVTIEGGDIITVDLKSDNNFVHNLTNESGGWSNIDLHVSEHSKIEVFWTNLKNKNIGKTIIKRKQSNLNYFDIISESELFRMHNKSHCSGLSYDWLRSLLFWSNEDEAMIYVTNTTSNQTSVLLQSGLDHPRSIVVDPFETRLYWIDLGSELLSPRIESMFMNNADRRIIIKDSLRQPQSLSIDFLDHRLYWSDINPGSIAFIDLIRPMRRRTVISNQLFHPFSLSIFEDKVFWTDWRLNQVLSVGKTFGNNIKLIKKHFKPMSIGIMNGLVKPLINFSELPIHSCMSYQTHPCSDLCLPSPPSYNISYASVKCVCAKGSSMSSNKKLCVDDVSSLVLPKNIHRFKIIVAVMSSLVIIFVFFTLIIVLYLCRDRLFSKVYKNISTQEIKHNIVTGDLMYIFRCQSHSSQLSELLTNDFNSTSMA